MQTSVADLITKVNGSPRYLGSIVAASATLINNKTTATPFSITAGSVLLLEFSGAGWVLPAASQAQRIGSTGGVSPSVVSDEPSNNPTLLTTGANGLSRSAGDQWLVILATDEDLLQVVGNGASTTVKVFELRSQK